MQQFAVDHFQKFSNLIYDQFGIRYHDNKRDILQSKLNKLISKNNMLSYDEYYSNLLVSQDRKLVAEFANEITVNYTSFFREKAHFDFLGEYAKELLAVKTSIYKHREIRIWSAACSSGEEPYTLAMVLKEALPPDTIIRILATDISSKALSTAQKGFYSKEITKDFQEKHYLEKYFYENQDGYYVSDRIKNMISFRSFNLMDKFLFKGNFDFIFCRNVMIYFDNSVRQNLMQKFFEILTPQGLLFIGHSESLAGYVHQFKNIQPAVYGKE